MFLESWEIAIKQKDLEAIIAGDVAARTRLADEVHDIEIYMHAYTPPDGDNDWTTVSIDFLMQLGIVKSATLNTWGDSQVPNQRPEKK